MRANQASAFDIMTLLGGSVVEGWSDMDGRWNGL